MDQLVEQKLVVLHVLGCEVIEGFPNTIMIAELPQFSGKKLGNFQPA